MTRRTSLVLLSALPAFAQLKGILDRVGRKSGADDKNASGIKEALLTGVNNAVGLASKLDGYFLNQAIKILLPDKLKPVETGLRLAGGSKLLDELVLGMNRAAEKAAPLAKDIFVDAVKGMSIADAVGIVRGGDTSATDFFRRGTEEKLLTAFRPPIADSMKSVGVANSYDAVMRRAKAIPFLKMEAIDLDGYVTQKAVAGLFYLIGDEEKKIRRDPAARVTPLLKEVFGGLVK